MSTLVLPVGSLSARKLQNKARSGLVRRNLKAGRFEHGNILFTRPLYEKLLLVIIVNHIVKFVCSFQIILFCILSSTLFINLIFLLPLFLIEPSKTQCVHGVIKILTSVLMVKANDLGS